MNDLPSTSQAISNGRTGATQGLRRKVLISGAIKCLQLGLGVGSSLLLARWLGAAGYGVYSFALALASLLAIPAQLGWPTLLTREVARAKHAGDQAVLHGVLTTASRWTFISSLAFVAVGLMIAGWVAANKQGQDPITLFVGCILILPLAWIGLRSAALRGLDLVIVAQVLDGVLRPLLFLLLVLFAFALQRLSPANAMVAQVVAVLVSVVFGSIVLTRVLPAGLKKVLPDVTRAKDWRRSLWPLMFVSAAQMITSQADLFVLGLVAETRTVGVYKVAVMVGTQVGFATWLVNAVFAPKIVKAFSVGDIIALRDLMRKGVRYVLVIAVPVSVGIVVFGRQILEFFLGVEYKDAYWPMVIIGVGQLLGVTAGPVGILLGMTGHERDVARVMAFTTIVSVIFTLVLAALFDAIGAAVATALTMVLMRYLLKKVALREFPEMTMY